MMTKERFWVVGGEYSCLAFKTLKNGAPQVMGPYETRDEARAAWKRISDETRSCATARYAIATEQLTLPH
ncbi:DUF4170 domain-containing protein [Phenylobacterium soli]|uniref:DUF4170 domain-containing protein n=2 Tax=Phenylobacterium soli TaxID=2170551 RepID=A0A328AGK9_9CAUL|nr:hypothetical protein DJ017_04635 [Phenylobacterium soli]